jgi:hypothetical protein
MVHVSELGGVETSYCDFQPSFIICHLSFLFLSFFLSSSSSFSFSFFFFFFFGIMI